MTATVELLDRWKARTGVTSDAAAARRLGLTRAAISHWRRRGTQAEPAVILRMCRDCGADVRDVFLQIARESRIR